VKLYRISLIEKVALEKEYLEKKSFLFDVKIFFMTFTSAFLKKGGVSH
jgi:lipopolysaccharide/colanic/teichoic acid biosynthesis glycosyltransferase